MYDIIFAPIYATIEAILRQVPPPDMRTKCNPTPAPGWGCLKPGCLNLLVYKHRTSEWPQVTGWQAKCICVFAKNKTNVDHFLAPSHPALALPGKFLSASIRPRSEPTRLTQFPTGKTILFVICWNTSQPCLTLELKIWARTPLERFHPNFPIRWCQFHVYMCLGVDVTTKIYNSYWNQLLELSSWLPWPLWHMYNVTISILL